jgi:hypothetical protein
MTLRVEWTSDDGTSERFFDYVTLSQLRQGLGCGHLVLLRPEEDNQGLTRHRATTRAGLGWFQEAPFCWDSPARRGSGRVKRFRGAGSLRDHSSGPRLGTMMT